jgi:hypothetical protein
MTISTYQVDNVIKAYTKQIKLNKRPSSSQILKGTEHYADLVSLSRDLEKQDAYQKISYSLLEVILKNRV